MVDLTPYEGEFPQLFKLISLRVIENSEVLK